ncbi:protein DpdF [Azospirillum isscasi]|uniref:Protein DpdF n=1 Tax=Azospirillum isscasi TaxID=3053926 RepID=A0ABU0WDG7_9PROT|nr:protein DpdF [Azospirillum isscasi]MDQ2102191.1 protein DpdF [Azospirillum isscasi]
MASLDFETLHDVLEGWPLTPVPARGADGVFDRIRQILFQAQALGRPARFSDLMSLLRHALRRRTLQTGATARLRVPADGDWPSRDDWARFGVRAQSVAVARYLIEAVAWAPAWMDAEDTPLFEDAFAERDVRIDRRRAIDPFLAEASGFTTYMSAGQREAVRSAFLLPPGETLVVSLPTGSGKSFVVQAPVLTRGLEGPLTICVVPTTALALDQARQMESLLKDRHPRLEIPTLAWHAGLTDDERSAVKSAIRQGTQGILYSSPEGVTGALLPALYDAARDGLLAYLVIDEAHLVSQWGDGFRPAFQMLAGVRRGLLGACGAVPFKTVLMSATLAPDTVATFDTLFGPAETVQMVSSIHLRPEPQYWTHREDDEDAKAAKILEAVRHAPRPCILYVTKRDDARDWLTRLRRAGFARSECFHGETNDADRRRIVDQWARNSLDIIVATSAFGVGIDKRDVRTVIHATVPETLDRFYQEVGRGGRDGRASASLLIYSAVDREIADNLAAPSLISEELGFERWSAMSGSARALDLMGTLLEVNLSVVPPRLNRETDYNAAWNMRTLIMMARANMLELRSLPPETLARQEGEAEAAYGLRADLYWARYFTRAVVQVSEVTHRNRDAFDVRISAERERSFKAAEAGRGLLDRLLSGAAEVSDLLHELYTSHAPRRTVVVSRACGGCSVDRRRDGPNVRYAEPASFGIEGVEPCDTRLFQERFPHLDAAAPVLLPLPGTLEAAEVVAILADLVSTFGIREIAVPDAMRGLEGLTLLHRNARDGILFVQSTDEEVATGLTAYRVARASLLASGPVPEHLLLLERPLHVILVPPAVPDPHHPGRRLAETGTNVLSFDQFKAGARR